MAKTLAEQLAALRDSVRAADAPTVLPAVATLDAPPPVPSAPTLDESTRFVALTREQVRALACVYCHSWPCVCDALHIGLWSEKAARARLLSRNVSDGKNVNETYKAGLRTGERYLDGRPPVRHIQLAPSEPKRRKAPAAKRNVRDATCPHCGRDPCQQRTWACIRHASAKKKAPAVASKAPRSKRSKR